MIDALFHENDGLLIPSPLTRGGWSDHAQHGGPPAGILARAIELVPTANPMQVVRFTIDIFREVPISPLSIQTEIVKDGRRIQLVEAILSASGVPVARAVALKIRRTDLKADITGTSALVVPPGPHPEDLPLFDGPDAFGLHDRLARFHTHAVEIRTLDQSFARPVPGQSWFRLRTTLIHGEKMTSYQTAATLSDLANGNAQALDPRDWMFVNPDITLYLHRYPVGDWLAMTSSAAQSSRGIGVTETRLFDTTGPTGHILQAQLIERR